MKVISQPEFLCSYYYHAAKTSADEISKCCLPQTIYRSLSALFLWQCVLESYANIQIHRYNLQNYSYHRGTETKDRMLGKASIKEKWIHLPIARSSGKKHFVQNTDPFMKFVDLIDLRNQLIHFDLEGLLFEKEAPTGVSTVGGLMSWMGTGAFFSGTILEKIMRCASEGEVIVKNMFNEYCKLTGDPMPDFLVGHETLAKVKIKK